MIKHQFLKTVEKKILDCTAQHGQPDVRELPTKPAGSEKKRGELEGMKVDLLHREPSTGGQQKGRNP